MVSNNIMTIAKSLGNSLTRANLAAALGIPVGSLNYKVGAKFTDILESIADDSPDVLAGGKRLPYKVREINIVHAAVDLAHACGCHYKQVQKSEVMAVAKVSRSTLNIYFPKTHDLHNAMVKYALKHGDYKILSQAILDGHPLTKNLPKKFKKGVMSKLSEDL